MVVGDNKGIQTKRKEQAKEFMMISNWKKNLHGLNQNNSAL